MRRVPRRRTSGAFAGLPALLLLLLSAGIGRAQPFHLPTPNRALYEPGGAARYFAPTQASSWPGGMFGCVRSHGRQFHEGIDILPVKRDARGEPADHVLAAAAGRVAYLNRRPARSNYGKYLILRHQVNGLEVFTIYAHLAVIAPDLRAGTPVAAGRTLGIMGRTANTRTPIARERGHLHFEIALRLSDHFGRWYRRHYPKQRNDHGEFNGRNFLGLDPIAIFREQAARLADFDLVRFLRRQPELCRVRVRDTRFSYLRRYSALLERNRRAEREGVAGYELVLNYVGVPCRLIPRAPGEMPGRERFQVVSVNEKELRAHPCRKLVRRDRRGWRLDRNGELLLDLLAD